jgi:hypothetical protein
MKEPSIERRADQAYGAIKSFLAMPEIGEVLPRSKLRSATG